MKDHDDYDDVHDGGTEAPKGMPTWVIILIVLSAPCVLIVPIGGVAAIAIPNLIEARKHGNEAVAIGSLRVLTTAQSIYREADSDGNGVADFGDLGALRKPQLIDEFLASGKKKGYVYECKPVKGQESRRWWAVASPQTKNTGNRWFFVDQTGVIRHSSEPISVDPSTGQPLKPCRVLGS